MSFVDDLFKDAVSNASTTIDYITSSNSSNFPVSSIDSTVLESPLDFMEAYSASLGYNLKLQRENAFLKNAIDTRNTDLYTNNRKTYYENQYILESSNAYKMWVFVYLFFYFIYLYLLFFVEQSTSFTLIYVYTMFLFWYPFLAYFISEWIVTLYLYVMTHPFVNPYLNITPADNLKPESIFIT